jgi:hypothetical protein
MDSRLGDRVLVLRDVDVQAGPGTQPDALLDDRHGVPHREQLPVDRHRRPLQSPVVAGILGLEPDVDGQRVDVLQEELLLARVVGRGIDDVGTVAEDILARRPALEVVGGRVGMELAAAKPEVDATVGTGAGHVCGLDIELDALDGCCHTV